MPTVTSTLSRSATPYRFPAAQAKVIAPARRAEAQHPRAQVLAERARIAREIHDILAHSLGSLFVQLDAAESLLGEGGDTARGRYLVGEARRLAAEALEETRRAIGALRANPVIFPEALAGLTLGDAGVSHQVTGRPRELRPDVGLALYRTAQEALANARKHAPGEPVAMTLSYEDREVVLMVANPAGDGDPSPLAATGGGYGLHGLRERAELLGGTLCAGPSSGTWIVELHVPA
jgi:signal transduction histidine kinase